MFLPQCEVYFAFLASGLPAVRGDTAGLSGEAWPPPAGLTTVSGRAAGPPTTPAGFLFRRSTKLCQNNTIGLATKTDEYVPISIPTTSANEKPCRTEPPKRNSARTVTKVKPEVKMVRLSVWFTLLLINVSSDSRR